MPDSPYRCTPSAPPRCGICRALVNADSDADDRGPLVCAACSSERYDLPVVLAVISLLAGASSGSMILVGGGLALSGLAASVIRRWF